MGATATDAYTPALLTEVQRLAALVAIAGVVFYFFFTYRTNYHFSILTLI